MFPDATRRDDMTCHGNMNRIAKQLKRSGCQVPTTNERGAEPVASLRMRIRRSLFSPFKPSSHAMVMNDNCHLVTYYFEWRHEGRCEMLFLHLAKGQSGSTLQLGFMRYTQKRGIRTFAKVHGRWQADGDQLQLFGFSCTGEEGRDGLRPRDLLFVPVPGTNYREYRDDCSRKLKFVGKLVLRRSPLALGDAPPVVLGPPPAPLLQMPFLEAEPDDDVAEEDDAHGWHEESEDDADAEGHHDGWHGHLHVGVTMVVVNNYFLGPLCAQPDHDGHSGESDGQSSSSESTFSEWSKVSSGAGRTSRHNKMPRQ